METTLKHLFLPFLLTLAAHTALLAQTWTSGSGGAIYYSGGNVGIGTTTPEARLDVSGDTSITGGAFFKSQIATLQGAGVVLDFIGGTYGRIQPWNNSTGTPLALAINPMGGNVGIGTASPQHLLQVAGTIGAEQVIVSSTGADYVFDPGYRLAPLSEVAKYVRANHHLPGIPSAEEMSKQGVSVGEIQTKLLAKIEELTLHMIQLEHYNDELQQELREIRDRDSAKQRR